MLYKIGIARLEDIQDVFNLSNDSDVRKNSFNTSKIIWQDHVKWFEDKIINNDDCVYFVVRNELNKFIGQVRFDRIADEKNAYIVNISLHKDFRGKGLGTELLQKCANKLFYDFDAKKIYAYVREINEPSLKTFNKIGYKIVGDKICNDVKFLKLQYCKN